MKTLKKFIGQSLLAFSCLFRFPLESHVKAPSLQPRTYSTESFYDELIRALDALPQAEFNRLRKAEKACRKDNAKYNRRPTLLFYGFDDEMDEVSNRMLIKEFDRQES